MANILLIDDNIELLKMERSFLESAGHKVCTATNGIQAMQLVRKNSYELIVTDILMPEKEGIETILEIRKKYKSVKIIAVSGGGRIDAINYLDMALAMGATQTLQKPFSGKKLLEVITEVLVA